MSRPSSKLAWRRRPEARRRGWEGSTRGESTAFEMQRGVHRRSARRDRSEIRGVFVFVFVFVFVGGWRLAARGGGGGVREDDEGS